MQYKQDEQTTRVMNMSKVADEELWRFSYFELDQSKDTFSDDVSYVNVTFAELRNLQLLLKYAVPSILGWHTLYEPAVVNPSHPD